MSIHPLRTEMDTDGARAQGHWQQSKFKTSLSCIKPMSKKEGMKEEETRKAEGEKEEMEEMKEIKNLVSDFTSCHNMCGRTRALRHPCNLNSKIKQNTAKLRPRLDLRAASESSS